MNKESLVFTFGDLTIEYVIIQAGSDTTLPILLCFHGFGRGMEDFHDFKSFAQANQKMISFNLFHHGKSALDKNRIWQNPVSKEELKDFFEQLFIHLECQNIEILGYSMGGKLGLLLTELFPSRVKHLTLIAPDGLKITGIYKFASRTRIGTGIFRYVIKKPKTFFGLVKALNKLKLISNGQRRVMLINMSTYEKRKQVGEAWFVFSKVDPDIELIQSHINNHKIETLLLYGKYDKIIPYQQGEKFIAAIETGVLVLAPQGHALMNYRALENLLKAKKRSC